MRFAIKTSPQHTTWTDMLAVWQRADEIDIFESAWNFDHFYPIFSDSTGPCLEAWTMLAAMANATRRIRLGVLVTGNIYRHPAVLAKMAATIDVISNGRLELGIGAGWNEMETAAYGIDLYPLKERFDRFDEGTQAIIALLTEKVANFDGKYIKLTDAYCEPKAVQTPHPPITIGGKGPNRTLRAVARWAQQWNVLVPNPQEWKQLKDVLVQRCEEVGRDVNEITCSTNVRIDPDVPLDTAVAAAAAYGEAGVDLVVLNLPLDAPPSVLEPLAKALAPLA